MAIEIILPKVDMDMATGTISRWHVAAGDLVVAGAPLFEIETDKATMEIDAPGDGTIANLAPAGLRIPVGHRIAHIFREGEEVVGEEFELKAITLPAAAYPLSKGQILFCRVPGVGDGLRATPKARKLARDHGLVLESIAGTGLRGRITTEDLLAAHPEIPQHGVRQELNQMRRTIAERLTKAKQTIPHFYLSITCDVTDLLELRTQLNSEAEKNGSDIRLSLNDFIIKAHGLALAQVPETNAIWQEGSLVRFDTSDVAIAVAVEGGIFTPVIQAIEQKSLLEISAAVKHLSAKAQLRKLTPSEYHGGTSSISNLGMYGIDEFTAIINPPHATLLAIGAVNEQFVPIAGQPVIRSLMKCTLSCDHRIVDGVAGAKLLAAFRALLQDPKRLTA